MWILASLAFFAAFALKAAELPRIDLIEWFPRYPNDVVLHFATPADSTTTLQYLDRIATNAVVTNSSTGGSWSNLYTSVNRLPFPIHEVFVDKATNSRQRFYRLRVTP